MALVVFPLSYQRMAQVLDGIPAVALVLHAVGVVADPVVRVAMVILGVIPRGEFIVPRLLNVRM